MKADSHAIVEAAEKLFRQLGFRKTVIGDIAREMGMSPANVYRFFHSRDALCEAVCRKHLRKMEQGAQRIARSNGPAAARLIRMLTAIAVDRLNLRRNDPLLHDLLQHAAEAQWQAVRDHDHAVNELLDDVICDGMHAGEFRRGDVGQATNLLRIACLRYLDPRLPPPGANEPSFGLMLDFCLAALRGEPAQLEICEAAE